MDVLVEIGVLTPSGGVIHERDEPQERVVTQIIEQTWRARIGDLAAIVKVVVDTKPPRDLGVGNGVERRDKRVSSEPVAA